MVYPAVFIAQRRGGGVRARRKAAPARSRHKLWLNSLRQRRHSLSFAHVFQLYGGFNLRAVARTKGALASCRADAAVLSSVFIAR